MSWAHVHLAVNHFPVVGAVLALLFFVWAISRGEGEHVRMALVFFVVVALLGVATYFTGEPAEHAVEDLAGISESLVEEHEEAAGTSTIVLAALGLLAGFGLFVSRQARKLPRWLGPAVLVLALVATGAMAWTATLGGHIRHPEIRPETATEAPASSGEAPEDPGG